MINAESIPAISAAQMAEVDRIMIHELGVDVLQLMEVAGFAVARFARERFLGDANGKRVLVLCGSGGNGGDGLVAARFLHGWGASVSVLLSARPDPARGVAAHQLAILERMPVEIALGGPAILPESDLIIDALLGFSLVGAPTGETAALIRGANDSHGPILAVDLPSGLDATHGVAFDPCIRATATLTLALPKKGLFAPDVEAQVGELYVADIGVPPFVYRRLGVSIEPLFGASDPIQIR